MKYPLPSKATNSKLGRGGNSYNYAVKQVYVASQLNSFWCATLRVLSLLYIRNIEGEREEEARNYMIIITDTL